MQEKHAEQLAARDESHQANGERSLGLESKSNGQESVSNGEDWAAKAAVQREEVGPVVVLVVVSVQARGQLQVVFTRGRKHKERF